MKHVTIKGEVNILRYLSRLGPPKFNYELDNDPVTSARLDDVLDICYSLARTGTVEEQQSFIRALNNNLGTSQFMAGGNKISVADVAVWSVLRQIDVKPQRDLSYNMNEWLHHCSQLLGIGKAECLKIVFWQHASQNRYKETDVVLQFSPYPDL
jgi:hypothetical protein